MYIFQDILNLLIFALPVYDDPKNIIKTGQHQNLSMTIMFL